MNEGGSQGGLSEEETLEVSPGCKALEKEHVGLREQQGQKPMAQTSLATLRHEAGARGSR